MKISHIYFCFLLLFILHSKSFSQVNTEKFRQNADSTGLTENFNVEGTAITGNTDFQFISLGGNLNYNWGNDYTFLVIDGGIGWKDGESFSNQALMHLRHVVSTGGILQLEIFTQYDFNKDRLLLNRELIGGGIRLKIYTNESFKIRYGLAYMFEHELYELPFISRGDRNIFTHRVSSYATLEIELQKYLLFSSVTYFQPDVEDLSDYRIISENTFKVIMGKLVDLNIKFNLRYDSLPPETVKKLDIISKFGLSFKI